MEIVQPERLAFLLLLPLLYLLSLPPRPRRTRLTAHLDQWLAARRKLGRRPVRFRWWRFLLLAAAFLAVVLAHTDPRLPGTAGPTELVVLVDTSASMAAGRPGGATAFEQARAAVDEVLERLPAHIAVRLGLCGDGIQVVRGERPELRRALAAIRPAGRGTVDLQRLVDDLQSATTAVWTLTDGLGPTRAPVGGALRRVGGPQGNAGITACVVEDSWPLAGVKVTVRVYNGLTGAAQRRFELTCTGGIAAPVRQPVTVPAGRSEEVEFAVQRDAGGALRIALGGGHRDGLALDDSVTVWLPAPPRPTIVVRAGDGEPSAGLLAGARALAAECGGTVQVGGDQTRAGFVLLEGGELAAPPEQVRMLSFGTRFAGQDPPRTPGPRLLDWHRSHPVTVGLDLSELRIVRALAWPPGGSFPAAGDTVLLEGDQGALAVLRGVGERAAVHLAFGLADSNLYKLAAFPQFLRRCLAASYGQKARAKVAPDALLDPSESLLAGRSAGGDRPLPAFARRSRGLAVPLLVLALLLLAIRVYV